MSNTSGNDNGYGDFISTSIDLILGSNNTITITPKWNGKPTTESYCVWIDYNQDGDFEDTGELSFSKIKSKSNSVGGSITVPSTALLGPTRMRVAMKNNTLPNSCEIFPYGEVEDYTVNITVSTAKESDFVESVEKTKPTLIIFPNPAKGDILNISNLEEPSDFRIYNLLGQELERNHIENNSIYVGALKKGVYIIEISNDSSITTMRFIKE